jgi:hypothetical protein
VIRSSDFGEELIFTYLVMVYLTGLSVAQPIQRQMVGWLTNKELGRMYMEEPLSSLK